MAIQSLQDFRASFGMDPVETEIRFGKDAAFSLSAYLKPLSVARRGRLEQRVVNAKGKHLENLREEVVADCWVNSEGKPIATVKEIAEEQAEAVCAIFEKILEVNGMSTKDGKKSVEEEKND